MSARAFLRCSALCLRPFSSKSSDHPHGTLYGKSFGRLSTQESHHIPLVGSLPQALQYGGQRTSNCLLSDAISCIIKSILGMSDLLRAKVCLRSQRLPRLTVIFSSSALSVLMRHRITEPRFLALHCALYARCFPISSSRSSASSGLSTGLMCDLAEARISASSFFARINSAMPAFSAAANLSARCSEADRTP